jgi:hypothetical protein
MTETWGWFIDIEKEYEYKNDKNQIKNTILHNIQDTIYEEKEYYVQTTHKNNTNNKNKNNENQIKNDEKNVFPYNTYVKRETSENLSEFVDPFTLILFSLIVCGYILTVI